MDKHKYIELFSYQTLSGTHWASVVIDTETGKPHTAVYGEMCIGGGRVSDVVSVGGEITFAEIYEYALRKQKDDFCTWFEPEKYKDITELNWREYL